jgi:hypothetical protein
MSFGDLVFARFLWWIEPDDGCCVQGLFGSSGEIFILTA